MREADRISIQPVILSGGSGTRLWPLSRHSRPKQFLAVSFDSTHAFANAIVRHVALSEDAILIDLAAAHIWSGEDVYDGLHFTEAGSRRVGEIVSRELARHITSTRESGFGRQVR